MHSRKHCFFDLDPSNIQIIRELGRSDASSIFEVELDGEKYAMKLVSLGCHFRDSCSHFSFTTTAILDIQRRVEI